MKKRQPKKVKGLGIDHSVEVVSLICFAKLNNGKIHQVALTVDQTEEVIDFLHSLFIDTFKLLPDECQDYLSWEIINAKKKTK